MASRYDKFVSTQDKVYVKKRVLFGDCKDTAISHAKSVKTPPSEEETIFTRAFTLRPVTDAMEGHYRHGKIYLMDGRFFHIIHLDHLESDKLAKYLCQVKGMDDHRNELVWSRYDWCHYRHWGRSLYPEDSENKDAEKEDAKDILDEDDDSVDDEEDDIKRYYIYFVSVDSEGNKIDEIVMDDECIEGHWIYGLRLVDKNTNLAFAYVFGDVLVNDILSCNVDEKALLCTEGNPFVVPVENFLK